MIDILNKKCEHEGCNFKPSFNYEEETIGRFCSEHKLKNMVNIYKKTCEFEGCSIQPSFNFKGEIIARFCSTHKLKDMIDIKHKTCEFKDCNIRASVGFCGQQVSRCASHKLNNMFMNPKQKCIDNTNNIKCKNIPIYGIKEPLHCEDHKIDDEICLIGQSCKKCGRNDEILNKSGLCLNYCEPDEKYQIIKLEKKQETLVLKYLDENFKRVNIQVLSDNKIIDSSCNKKRPDRIYDCGTHYVIVEIDERQHSGYCKDGELSRMYYIQAACGISCIFLRFNPDNFRVNNVLQQINIGHRLKTLVKWLNYCIDMKPSKDFSPVKYKYLYYNEYDEKDISFKELNELDYL